ncbi:hypothetical protein GOC60_32485 [Sinorhizobium meliloti]|nr:hypothetical protein [Sinorhizobium meliloti]MDX0265775.1 hypothetical protein [Sinorhizobium meliloti]MDX0353215.1 hypothetical protein [Sinorhizobium meliloti]
MTSVLTDGGTVEAHLRDILAGVASVSSAKFSPGFARIGGRIAGLGWQFFAPGDRDFFGVQFGSVTGRRRQI